ncbi:MAG TPA: response regulator [Methylocella sp.]|nr:response regulator [Methylocella sp.]
MQNQPVENAFEQELWCRSTVGQTTPDGKAPHLQILSDQRILIVEDEALIAFEIEDAIKEAGGVVVGPFATVAGAMQPLEKEWLSAAILDVRLGDVTSLPIARRLAEKRIPFLFYTACSELIECPFLTQIVQKPAAPHVLIAAVALLIGPEPPPNPGSIRAA